MPGWAMSRKPQSKSTDPQIGTLKQLEVVMSRGPGKIMRAILKAIEPEDVYEVTAHQIARTIYGHHTLPKHMRAINRAMAILDVDGWESVPQPFAKGHVTTFVNITRKLAADRVRLTGISAHMSKVDVLPITKRIPFRARRDAARENSRRIGQALDVAISAYTKEQCGG